MTVIDTIVKRRSIRKYAGEIIEKAKIDTILKAGFYASTAQNLQTSSFEVIQDSEKLKKIATE